MSCPEKIYDLLHEGEAIQVRVRCNESSFKAMSHPNATYNASGPTALDAVANLLHAHGDSILNPPAEPAPEPMPDFPESLNQGEVDAAVADREPQEPVPESE